MRYVGVSRFALLGAGLMVVLSSGCGTEPSRVPTTIVVNPPNASLAAIGATQQFSAIVKDQRGDTLAGAGVAWATSNSAVLTASALGLATAVGNGTAQVRASSGTATQAVNVTVAQVPSSITLVSGNAQTGTVGQALGQPLLVQVDDVNAHPVPAITVTFATAAGSMGSASAQTGANGQAQSAWTLGTAAGAQTATASAAALPGTPITFTATAAAGAAATIAKQGGDSQSVPSGAAVTTAPSVVVRDSYGNPKPGAIITFAVASGGGSLTKPIDTTDASGVASVGSWTLGALGTNQLSASVAGAGVTGNPATFSATALPATGPATMAAFVGNNQTGLIGFKVNVRPAVRVTDASSAPVAGASVTFAVVSGGGSVTGATVLTNGSGVAQVGNWQLGSAAGTNTLTATLPGAGIVGNPLTLTATGATPAYNITIQNVGPALSSPVQAAFNSAVAKWQRIIYRDLPDIVNLSAAAGDCGSWTPAVGPVNVDDVLIIVKFDSLDGPGHVLGSAGPCYVRNADHLTILGAMRFDTADVAGLIASGQLNDVIAHEMGHVLGFGTLWTQAAFNCLQSPSAADVPIDTYYSCDSALAMFDSIGGTTYTGGQKVPVENCGPASPAGCGAGTMNGHWREPVLVDELMTGYLSIGVANPLSRLSAAAMEDLGYGVNYAGADAYVHTFTLRALGAAVPPLDLSDDIYRGPLHVVDPSGRVVRVIHPGARR